MGAKKNGAQRAGCDAVVAAASHSEAYRGPRHPVRRLLATPLGILYGALK
jgi:hypothetical protein